MENVASYHNGQTKTRKGQFRVTTVTIQPSAKTAEVMMGRVRQINSFDHSQVIQSIIAITSSSKWQVSRLVDCSESVNFASKRRFIVSVSSAPCVGRKTAPATKWNG